MTKLKFNNSNTNWKYILIVIILAFITGGGILGYGRIIQEKIIPPEIKIPKEVQDYTTPEAKEIVPILKEKKISNELANIFREEIKKDLNIEYDYYPETNNLRVFDIDCFRSESIDLNSDRTEEFIIFPGWFCGGGEIRGASGGGPIYIFQKINNEWKIIGKLEGSMVDIETRKTGGYHDITTFWPLGAGSAVVNSYQWEGSILSYELKKSEQTEVGL